VGSDTPFAVLVRIFKINVTEQNRKAGSNVSFDPAFGSSFDNGPAGMLLWQARSDRLHLASVQLCDLLNAGFTRVAGTAGVGKGALGKEGDVLFLQNPLQIGGDAHVGGKLFDRRNGRVGGLCVAHGIDTGNIHCLADRAVALAGDRLVIFQTDRQQNGAGEAVRRIVKSGQAVRS